MKNLYSLFIQLLACGILFAQPGLNLPSNYSLENQVVLSDKNSKAPAYSFKKGKIVDTLNYYIEKPGKQISASTMNRINETEDQSTDAGYSGYAMRFPAPDSISLKGVCFYAWVEVGFMPVEVEVNIYSVGVDGLPDQKLRTESAFVDVVPNYNGSKVSEDIQYCVIYDERLKIKEDYIVALETETTLKLWIGGDKFGDLSGEGTSLAYYYKESNHTWDGWYYQNTFGDDWKFNRYILPLVEYTWDSDFTLNETEFCESDSIRFSPSLGEFSGSTELFKNKYYNSNTSDTVVTRSQHFDFGTGSFISDSASTMSPGSYEVVMRDSLTFPGWGQTYGYLDSKDNINVKGNASIDVFETEEIGYGKARFETEVSHADSILWNFGDMNTSKELIDTNAYLSNGTFDVSLITYSACKNDTSFAQITVTRLSDEILEVEEFQLYPNPSNGVIYVSTNELNKVEVYDIQGRSVFFNNNVSSNKIDLSKLEKGSYTIKIVLNSGSISTKNVLIR